LTAVIFFFVDPAFHADDSVNGAGFCEAVVERDAEGLKRDFTFAVAFSTCDVSTTEAACATNANSFCAKFHGGLNGAFHGSAESDTTLKLDCDLLGDELCVEFRLTDFENVEFDLGVFADFLDLSGHDLDLFALATDDEARTGRMKGDADAVPCTLNDNASKTCIDQFSFEVCADREIFVEFGGIVFACGVPFGAPVFIDGETEGDRIYFLAHGVRWRVIK
jgi:hypothetical protein